jgi:hypothetical protein
LSVEETLVRVQELPLYHIRERGKPVAHTKLMKTDKVYLSVWEGISRMRVIQFDGFENNMNGALYCEILLKYVLPFASDVNSENIIFHQDNASTHTGQPAKSFLPQIGINCVKFFDF